MPRCIAVTKLRTIGIVGVVVLLAVVAGIFRLNDRPLNRSEAGESAMFMGLRHATATEIRDTFPDARDKPLLVSFSSRYCLDCKKMDPIVKKEMAAFPGVTQVTFDIGQDRKTHPGVFNAFKPVSVPTLVFIRPDGTIANVLYNDQPPAAVRAALHTISTDTPAAGL